jgi:hypothetical protein
MMELRQSFCEWGRQTMPTLLAAALARPGEAACLPKIQSAGAGSAATRLSAFRIFIQKSVLAGVRHQNRGNKCNRA